MATQYTVKKGDTLNQIAQQFGYDSYKTAGLTAKSGNPDLIYPGETYSINPAATSPAKDAFISNAAGSGSSSPLDSSGGAPGGTGTPAPSDPFSAYRKYLSEYQSSLNEPEDLTGARTSLANISGQIDERDLAARREYEKTLDAPGMLKAGAEQSAALSRRRSNSELADMAVRQSAAARNLEALSSGQTAKQQFYKTRAELAKPFEVAGQYYDPTTGQRIESPADSPDPFTISPGQSRYEYNKDTGQYELVASVAPLPRVGSQPTERQLEAPMKQDISDAISQLKQIKTANGWEGVSMDDYNEMANYLLSTYGYDAVIELDEAMKALGLTVDLNPEGKGLTAPK
jgi:LysM repeat protein